MKKKQTQIIEFLSQYDQRSISLGFFVLTSWLPNRSAYIRLLFALTCGLTQKRNDEGLKYIQTYKDFEKFCKGLFDIIEEFPTLEDYIPEDDWGEIKYHFNKLQYKIFYGTELSWTYDYLSSFEIIYKEYSKKIYNCLNRDPFNDFHISLRLQDKLIQNIKNKKETTEINPGHLEKPVLSKNYNSLNFL